MSQRFILSSKIGFFLWLFFAALCTHAQRHHLLFQSTFDSANAIGLWYEQSLFHPWSGTVANNPSRAGNGSLRVELIRSADTTNGPRAELGQPPQTQSEFWYGFANFFPFAYAKDPATEIVNQWQALPDFALGEGWRSPPLALEIKDDRYKIAIRWSASAVNSNATAGVDYLDVGPVTHNRWNDWVLHVKWNYNGGVLQVWRNDTLVLNRNNQPIGYNDINYPYFKTGIYKWEWSMANTVSTSTNRTYFIDEVRIGDNLATYNDVFPGPAMASQVLPVKTNSLEVKQNGDGSYTASFFASASTGPKKFILYVSEDGKSFHRLYSAESMSLIQDNYYTLKFNPK